MSATVTTEACPWCEGTAWTVKTIEGVLRVKCDGCNAGFRPEDLSDAVQRRGVRQ